MDWMARARGPGRGARGESRHGMAVRRRPRVAGRAGARRVARALASGASVTRSRSAPRFSRRSHSAGSCRRRGSGGSSVARS